MKIIFLSLMFFNEVLISLKSLSFCFCCWLLHCSRADAWLRYSYPAWLTWKDKWLEALIWQFVVCSLIFLLLLRPPPYSCTNVENGRAAATFAPKRTPQLSLISLGVFLKSVVNTHLLWSPKNSVLTFKKWLIKFKHYSTVIRYLWKITQERVKYLRVMHLKKDNTV